MKTYSVKEIAEMLNTNPETVRRWIRDKKLEATIESKKGGRIVCEATLHEFLKSSPKYAAAAKALLARNTVEAAVFPTVMIVRLIAQKLIDVVQLKNTHISNDDVIDFLHVEIKKYTEAIKAKKDAIQQLQKQIEADQLQITEFQKLIDNLSVAKEEAHD